MTMGRKLRWTLVAGFAAIVAVACFFALRTHHPRELPPSVPPPSSKVTPQLISRWHSVTFLAPDGSIWTWGDVPSDFGRPSEFPRRIGFSSDWVQVDFNNLFALALKRDGSLWGWGWADPSGNLFSHSNTLFRAPIRLGSDTNWTRVRTGSGHALALKRDGSLWAWGRNNYGQVGDGTTSNKFSPQWISSKFSPQWIGSEKWTEIAAGTFNSFALKSDGTIWGWGFDFLGFRKNVLVPNQLVPAQLDPATNWIALSAGDYHLLALKSDGTLWIFGRNAQATASAYVSAPATNFVQVGSDANWREIYSGGNNFLARKADGSWWACGNNSMGQLGLGDRGRADELTRVPFDISPWAIAVGGSATFLLTGDGTLWSWGQRLGADREPVTWKSFKHRINQTGIAHFNTNDVPQFNLLPEKIWSVDLTRPVDKK